jgi:3-phosphoshikimate 1-carboxyvinyltransferase
MSIRALAVAGLATGRSHIYGGLEADDPAAMGDVLEGFGVASDRGADPWVVDGVWGRPGLPPSSLSAGESALTARIAIAMACLVDGTTTIDGGQGLRRRPMGSLLTALASQGVGTTSRDGGLPVTVRGAGRPPGGEIVVDSTVSSQFATAILLVAPYALRDVTLRVEGGRVSAGYMGLTTDIMAAFGVAVTPTITGYEVPVGGYTATDVEIEPDLSAAVYPMVAAAITGSRVLIEGVTRSSRQPDVVVAEWLARMGCQVDDQARGLVVQGPDTGLAPMTGDLGGAPDGALALTVACLFAEGPSHLTGLGTLRHKESDRLTAMVDGIRRLGGSIEIEGDNLVIDPRRLHGAVIDPHGDHRVAMSLALAGLRVDDVLVAQPGVVDKTWPGYWEVMSGMISGTPTTERAHPPPHVEI